MKGEQIYLFNEKNGQQPAQMYVYDLGKTDTSDALSMTEDVHELETIYQEWKRFLKITCWRHFRIWRTGITGTV